MILNDSRAGVIGGMLIFLSTFVAFRLSPVHQMYDSTYSMLFSQQLLRHGSFSLPKKAFPELQLRKEGEILTQGTTLSYRLVQVGSRFYYFFPPGTPILSMPYVALMNSMGIYATDKHGTYDHDGEIRIEAGLAALLMASLAVVLFHTARLLLSFSWSLLIAFGAAFGSQMWSTASRAMWADTWGIFILGLVIWLLLAVESSHLRYHRPIILATLLSWLYIVRPTYAIPILGITCYLFIYYRSIMIPYVATGCFWLAAFICYSRYHFGQILPDYYQVSRMTFHEFWLGLAGSLISPARGLLIYVPVTAFIAFLLLRYRTRWIMPRLVWLSLGVITVHLGVVSAWVAWYGGHCYGPRLLTGVVPWFVLLGILTLKTRLAYRTAAGGRTSIFQWRMEWAAGAVLLLMSVTINGIGSISQRATEWNRLPADVDYNLERLWDWSDPPFARAFAENKSLPQ